MTALAEAPRFPEPLDDDNDDVAWALQTAAVQWNRGGRADALVWLRRAVDSAIDLGLHDRAQELNRMTEALDSFVQAGGELGSVGGAPESSGSASSNDVDDLLGGRAELPSVELGTYEFATQSLVDAVELEAASADSDADLVGEVDIEQPFEAADEETEEIEELDDVELLDEDEIDAIDDEEEEPAATPVFALTESRPRLPPPRSPLPPPRSPLPPPRLPPPPPRSAVKEEVPAEPPSEPAAQAYRESSERIDETTHRRSSPFAVETSAPSDTGLESPFPSSPSKPYFEDDEMPTGVRELSPESLAALESEVAAAEPLGGPADEVTIAEAEPSFPVVVPAVAARESLASLPSVSDDELDIPDAEPEPTEPEPPPVASTRERAASVPAPPPAESETGEPSIWGIVLAEVRGLEDLPPETQRELVANARVESLAADEEISAFGLALVLKGSVAVMPAIADVACARASAGEPVFCTGNLKEGVEMRVVAQAGGAEIAVWQSEDFEGAMASCPWVAEELRNVADRFQALAGATMGPLGDGLDDMMRSMVTDRATVKRLEAGELLVEKGKALPGLHIVGAGRLELEGGGEHLPGDLLFASQILGGGGTPATVRAGDQGALVLFIDRMTTHELMMSVPPLLELLATS